MLKEERKFAIHFHNKILDEKLNYIIDNNKEAAKKIDDYIKTIINIQNSHRFYKKLSISLIWCALISGIIGFYFSWFFHSVDYTTIGLIFSSFSMLILYFFKKSVHKSFYYYNQKEETLKELFDFINNYTKSPFF